MKKNINMTFRWYGEGNDTVELWHIKQTPGVKGIMGLLDYKAAGEVWEKDEIKTYLEGIRKAGLECKVIESVNVHEDIKLGRPTRDKYIQNYITTIENLAEFGIKVIIYNFMPVFDWLRTDLNHLIPEDGSYSLYFSEKDIEGLTPIDIVRNTSEESEGFTLPGWEPERLSHLQEVLEAYKGMTNEDLLVNYKYFLDAIIPVCERVGIRMACHPDDPGWPIFGLPRLAHDQEGYDKIIALHDSPCNTVCLCTGSLGSNVKNDIPAMIRHFGEKNRIAALHVRNVKHLGDDKVFRESAHLSEYGDLDMFAIMKAIYDTCPDAYIRPDHGRMIWGEKARPGYGLYDRALGATYLCGLWEAIDKMS